MLHTRMMKAEILSSTLDVFLNVFDRHKINLRLAYEFYFLISETLLDINGILMF